MSAAAAIVLAVVALLLLAMLLAGARKAATARNRHPGAVDYHLQPHRSHAEASRRADE